MEAAGGGGGGGRETVGNSPCWLGAEVPEGWGNAGLFRSVHVHVSMSGSMSAYQRAKDGSKRKVASDLKV